VTGVSNDEPVLFSSTAVAGEDYSQRAAHAFMLFQLRRPLVWIQIVLPLIVIPVLVIPFEPNPYSAPIAFGVDAFVLIVNAISWYTRRQSLANRLRMTAPPGTTRELAMTESTISVRIGDALSQAPYAYYESAESFRDFVFIRVRGSSIRSIVPRELFTDESLAFLRTKLVALPG
jgi:hypothetical protein